MQTFLVNGIYIEAEDQSTAELIESSCRGKSKLIIIRGKDGIQLINIPEDCAIEVWSKSGASVGYCGKIFGGTGQKIFDTAIDKVNVSLKERAKLANDVKRSRIEHRKVVDGDAVKTFESSIPRVAAALYEDVMRRVDATTVAYRIEIITNLNDAGVNSIPERNWIPLLSWFRDKVLVAEESLEMNKRRSFFALRKAFVTAAARIVKQDVRNANTMKLASEDSSRNPDFWMKYAEKQRGS